MGRVGVFVDAGYLFAEGAKAVFGETRPRWQIRLEYAEMVGELRSFATRAAPGSDLLRVYWYDGIRPSGMSGAQHALAYTNWVKMRLGLITESGRQKGVDGLIVADLIELARNGAISDAVLVSGDEDVRIGVQLAQSYGVRVHLLGIGRGRRNQSNALRQEADTVSEWNLNELQAFMSVISSPAVSTMNLPRGSVGNDSAIDQGTLDRIVEEVAKAFTQSQLDHIASLGQGGNLPSATDGILMATCRDALGRFMNTDEKWYVRGRLKQVARENAGTPNIP